MISEFRKLALRRWRRPLTGQITTFLILGLVVILIFVLVLANIGQVSATATALSNAADSTALNLGSQLATRANVLCHSLATPDNPEACEVQQCKWQIASWLTFVIAVVMNIIIPGSGILYALAVAGNTVWVTSFKEESLTRIVP